ncbi:glycosyltransferase family 4 protein [Glaciihabitans sp. dw_435]|uniref:glycosyltransferase family 4 protein n=1 Tax=Glaciihabitans sp. dw_435 TaxID=2720081 RepID=UPI001BD29A56|nr:glycosyltransferase family 4 protein [Glaciihabitans sp. dw_435]
MRIAIVSDFFLDYVGGLQSSIHEQQVALESAGHDVLLISTARLPRGPKIHPVAGGLQIRPAYVVPGVILPVVGARTKLIAHLRDYLVAEQVDVVHLQTEFGLAHAATTAAHEVGIPVVHTVHTFYWQSSGWWQAIVTPMMSLGLENVTQHRFPRRFFTARASDNLLRNLTLAMACRADTVISPSSHQADDLRAAGVTGPIVVVPNPIARSLRPAAELTPVQAARPRLLWVARCEPEKRPLAFAEAAIAALARTGDGFEVDFVGEGSELPALRALAGTHPNIHIHGGLEHDTVLDLIDASSAVALTSVGFDNQPMTIAEAVSRYRGVLYCDPKLSEGLQRAGFRSPTPDVAGLAYAIEELVTSPGTLLALSAGARADSATFSADTYVSRVMDVYDIAAERIALHPPLAETRLRLPPHA